MFFMMISGGSDSMALARLLVGKNISPVLIYADYNEISLGDNDPTKIVNNFARENNLELHTKKYVPHLHSNNKESDMRAFRFDFAKEVMQSYKSKDGYTLITAHHLNDRLEGSLMKLMKGSGIDGIVNMREKENASYKGFSYIHYRPLINVSKKEIEEMISGFGMVAGFDYWLDPSNNDESIERNWLRHNIVEPLIEKYKKEGLIDSFSKLEIESDDIQKCSSVHVVLEKSGKTSVYSEVIRKDCATNSLLYYLSKNICDKMGVKFTKSIFSLFKDSFFDKKEIMLRKNEKENVLFGFFECYGGINVVCVNVDKELEDGNYDYKTKLLCSAKFRRYHKSEVLKTLMR